MTRHTTAHRTRHTTTHHTRHTTAHRTRHTTAHHTYNNSSGVLPAHHSLDLQSITWYHSAILLQIRSLEEMFTRQGKMFTRYVPAFTQISSHIIGQNEKTSEEQVRLG